MPIYQLYAQSTIAGHQHDSMWRKQMSRYKDCCWLNHGLAIGHKTHIKLRIYKIKLHLIFRFRFLDSFRFFFLYIWSNLITYKEVGCPLFLKSKYTTVHNTEDTSENGRLNMCAEQRFKSACALALSYQNIPLRKHAYSNILKFSPPKN